LIAPLSFPCGPNDRHPDVHVHPEGSIQQFANDPAGHARLIAWITPERSITACFVVEQLALRSITAPFDGYVGHMLPDRNFCVQGVFSLTPGLGK
jgi:hypothetical protein